nr:OmpA family protein [Psychrobacter sp. PraFG1]UNK05578.1 OmpA family protein [Psychrobacter sp. PraFG1]
MANQSLIVSLQPKRTYYYQVSHVERGVTPVIRAVNTSEAIELLKGSIEQTHQISRVVTDNCMQPPTQTITTHPVTTPVMETQKPMNLDVLFDFDSAQIKGKYQQKIQLLGEYMQANPEATVHLESHTDSKGAAGYNLKLSS